LIVELNKTGLKEKNDNTMPRSSGGFTLVEILVALFVMLIGLSSVFALFAAATALHKRATDNSTAAILSDCIFSEVATQLTSGVQVEKIRKYNAAFPGYEGYKYDVELVAIDMEEEQNANEFFIRLTIRWQKQGRERNQVFATIINRRIPFKGREYYSSDNE